MTRIGCAVAAVLLWAADVAAQGPVDPSLAISYVLTAEMDGNPGGQWVVHQGPDLAVARWSSDEGPGDVALVAGPAVGGRPAQPVDDFGELLNVLFDPAAEIGPGYRKASRYGSGTAVVDSLHLDLGEGNVHEPIAGHDTRHHVLTARLWWRHRADDGTETRVLDTGVVDLWFAPSLPFSWLPFGVHPAQPGIGLPLSFWWPEVAEAAVGRFGARFEALGLLMRARSRDESRPDENPAAVFQLMGTELTSALSLSDLRPAEDRPDPEPFVGLPRLARSRVLSLKVAPFVLDPCESLESLAGGTFQLVVSGPRGYRGGGPVALLLRHEGVDDAYVLVAGSAGEQGSECTLILLPGDPPRPGTFPVMALRPDFGETGADSAIAMHVLAGAQGLQRILLLDSGHVRIDESGAGGVSGRLEARGWALEPRPGLPPEVIEGLEVDMSFHAVPAPESP